MRKHRKTKQKKIIIISTLGLFLIITAGYAAFQANLNITAKGNIKEYTSKNYVQDSLFLHLDGIDNDTTGHNSSANTWNNLINNNYGLKMYVSNNLNWTDDNGLYFDGVDDYIDAGFNQSVLGGNITIDIVLKTDEINNYRGLIGYHADAIPPTYLHLYEGFTIQFMDNSLTFFYYNSSLQSDCSISLNSEQTMNLVNNKVELTFLMSENNYISIYINGKETAKTECNISFSPWKEDNLILAKTYKYSSDRYFKGTIYNYKIYRKTLTDDEIKENYLINQNRYGLK